MRVIATVAALTLGLVAMLSSQSIPQDTGAAGAWQKIQKVRTTASVLHGTAHPDDENGGVLAKLSRKDGARVVLMTLTRGESGDNAIGPQLFEGLALIRTDELLTADKYYGVDQQYFTTMIDYGFSKRLDETTDKWGFENAMRDVVRVIRMERPWVIISRFQGNTRDGHGNHQAAGLLSQQAGEAAGSSTAFPEQIAEGCGHGGRSRSTWAGCRPARTGRFASTPESTARGSWRPYANIASFGLSFQRSQNSRAVRAGRRPDLRVHADRVARRGTGEENSFFDGIDTTYAGLFKTLGRPAPAGIDATLAAIDAAAAKAAATFTFTDPSTAVPALADGLRLTREAIGKSGGEADALFVLGIKERQFQDAINAAAGLDLMSSAQPSATPPPAGGGRGGGRGGVVAMPAPVPGQTFGVTVRLANRGGVPIQLAAGGGVQLRTEPDGVPRRRSPFRRRSDPCLARVQQPAHQGHWIASRC
jgi:LmbE family N-acetylglucosaminyl deacetylase